jgi:hypothetical protein
MSRSYIPENSVLIAETASRMAEPDGRIVGPDVEVTQAQARARVAGLEGLNGNYSANGALE